MVGPMPCSTDFGAAARRAALEADPYVHYHRQPPALTEVLATVAGNGDPELAAAFDHMLLCWLIRRATDGTRTRDVPPRLAAEIDLHYERILARAEAGLEALPALGKDLFAKDVGVCTGRMLPAQFAVMQSQMRLARSLARSLARLGGARQFLEFCGLYYGRFGGRGPFLASHFHPACARYFNQAGRLQLFRVVAEIFAWRPELKAFTGDAWYYDPVVAKISPHMAYIRDFPEAHGARLFRGPVDTGGTALTSAKRRRLYEAGEYEPRRYTMVWPRRALLEWAARDEG
jgi:hypothetical protein